MPTYPSDADDIVVFGDTRGSLAGFRHGQDGVVTAEPPVGAVTEGVTAVGDADTLRLAAVGGDDTVLASGFNVAAIGDAFRIVGFSRGGDDIVRVGAGPHGWAYGDAELIRDFGRGGSDSVSGSLGSGGGTLELYGDAGRLTDLAAGGDDTLSGTTALNGVVILFGDAGLMDGASRGGDDRLLGATVRPTEYGDAQTLSGWAAGGDDTISGAAASFFGAGAEMYGDGERLDDHARGGDDRLIGGAGDDSLWGDAAVIGPNARTGADTFVIAPGGGADQIMDFEAGKDRIDFDAFGFSTFADVASRATVTADGLLITFSATDSLLVRGVSQLTGGDFVFG